MYAIAVVCNGIVHDGGPINERTTVRTRRIDPILIIMNEISNDRVVIGGYDNPIVTVLKDAVYDAVRL